MDPTQPDNKNKNKSESSRTRGNVRTLADLNRPARDDSGSDSDEPQEYYTGGEKRYSFLFRIYTLLGFLCLVAEKTEETLNY